MEDVLEVYKLPHDPKVPLVCMDETSKQQVKEVRAPIPMSPGKCQRYDNEYERNGVSALFMFFAPLEDWRHVATVFVWLWITSTLMRRLGFIKPLSQKKLAA